MTQSLHDRHEPLRFTPSARAKINRLAKVFAEATPPRGEPHPFASWVLPTHDGSPGAVPWVNYSPPVEEFWRFVEQAGLLQTSLDWAAWLSSVRREGYDPFDPAFIANLTASDLSRLVTVLHRGERFTDGVWAQALERGTFDALLARALELDSK